MALFACPQHFPRAAQKSKQGRAGGETMKQALTIRGLMERASRGIVLRRRLPASLGGTRLYVSPEAGGLRYWRFDLEKVDPILLGLARELVVPGSIVWDIGANLGLFAFAAAHLAGSGGQVVAIEPDVDNASLLYRSRRAQLGGARVDVVVAAVAGEPCIAQLAVAQRARSANALAGLGGRHNVTSGGSLPHWQENFMGGVREVRHVMTVTLDQLAREFAPPSVLKIDVEGAEALVLKGGLHLLGTHHPTLIVEVCSEASEKVTITLRDLGYELHDGEVAGHPRVETACFCTLAMPPPQREPLLGRPPLD